MIVLFLCILSMTNCLVLVGKNNSYRLPNKEVLNNLDNLKYIEQFKMIVLYSKKKITNIKY